MNMNFLEFFMNNKLYKTYQKVLINESLIMISPCKINLCTMKKNSNLCSLYLYCTLNSYNMTYMRHEISVKKTSTLIYF